MVRSVNNVATIIVYYLCVTIITIITRRVTHMAQIDTAIDLVNLALKTTSLLIIIIINILLAFYLHMVIIRSNIHPYQKSNPI